MTTETKFIEIALYNNEVKTININSIHLVEKDFNGYVKITLNNELDYAGKMVVINTTNTYFSVVSKLPK